MDPADGVIDAFKRAYPEIRYPSRRLNVVGRELRDLADEIIRAADNVRSPARPAGRKLGWTHYARKAVETLNHLCIARTGTALSNKKTLGGPDTFSFAYEVLKIADVPLGRLTSEKQLRHFLKNHPPRNTISQIKAERHLRTLTRDLRSLVRTIETSCGELYG
jgi:hypothetical protein